MESSLANTKDLGAKQNLFIGSSAFRARRDPRTIWLNQMVPFGTALQSLLGYFQPRMESSTRDRDHCLSAVTVLKCLFLNWKERIPSWCSFPMIILCPEHSPKKLLLSFYAGLHIIENMYGVSSRLLQSRLNISSSFNNSSWEIIPYCSPFFPWMHCICQQLPPNLVPESHEILHKWANQWSVSGEANIFLFSSVLPIPPAFPIFILWINPCFSLSKSGHLRETHKCHYE